MVLPVFEAKDGIAHDSAIFNVKTPAIFRPKFFDDSLQQAPCCDALEGFPDRLEGDLCWRPGNFAPQLQQSIVRLNEWDLHHVMTAVHHFKELNIPLAQLEPDNFPLPRGLADRLRRVSEIVHHGLGLAIIRGLNPKLMSDLDNVVAYCGLASYVGAHRYTNSYGMSMVHVRDATRDVKPLTTEHVYLHPTKINAGMKFHADRFYADIISLYVRGKPAVGGEQLFASFWTIYNRLKEEDPETLRVLAQDWNWLPDRTAPEDATNIVPAMLCASGRVIAQFVRQPYIEHPEMATPEQMKALTTVQRIAEEECISLPSELGDIQFFNNFALIHSRTPWKDTAEETRHLLRLGLRDPQQAWDLPAKFRENFEEVFSVPPHMQTIPVTDFDPYFKTTTNTQNHG